MTKCSDSCIPCCDFCAHVIHGILLIDGKEYSGQPIGCSLRENKEHQLVATSCGCCNDFYCILTGKEASK